MAKMNKIMPPRNTTIRGQDHLLAYITPEEAQMLMDNGGAGKAGPMGIPAFYGFGSHDDASSQVDYGGGPSTDDNDSGNDSYDTISRAAEKDFGTPDPTSKDIEDARGFDFGSDASDALIAQIQGGYGGSMLGDKYAGSGFENQMFFDQLPDRLANAATLPGLLGAGSTYMLNKMKDQVLAGGIPAFSAAVPRGGLTGYGDRAFQGVFSKGPFGFDVYTGMPIEGNELTGYNAGGGESGFGDTRPEVAPPNPATGQCDEGYMFDPDLQACRLDTGGDQPSTGGATFAPGAYARMGLLDQAPTGLPEFRQQYGTGFGTPSEFADANLAFRRQGAYRPQYFDQPYPTTGYTLLS
jgi:hypothetical protein